MRRTAAIALAVATCGATFAAAGQVRGDGTGLLDVPDAEALGVSSSVLSVELRADRGRDGSSSVGLSPLAAALGLGRAEIAFALREAGMPGDPPPSTPLATGSLKVHLLDADGARPALALGAVLDRFNWHAVGGARLIASTEPLGRVRIAAFAGVEADRAIVRELRPAGGAGALLALSERLELIAGALAGPRGQKIETALRWYPAQWLGVTTGVERLPGDGATRFLIGLSVSQQPRAKPRPPPRLAPAAEQPKAAPAPPTFRDERPRFRLRIRTEPLPDEASGRHEQDPTPARPADGRAR